MSGWAAHKKRGCVEPSAEVDRAVLAAHTANNAWRTAIGQGVADCDFNNTTGGEEYAAMDKAFKRVERLIKRGAKATPTLACQMYAWAAMERKHQQDYARQKGVIEW